MKLSELLFATEQIAKDKGLSRPYIVGGLARDKLLNNVKTIEDVDLTTGDESIHDLARHLAVKLGPYADYIEMPDGHSTIHIGNFKLDFSSNFKIPGVAKLLHSAGITNPSDMQKELYSRDFTCNTALMTLDLSKILDPTGLAVEDIQNKIIKTCLPANITLGYDNKRIVRAIYLAAKLNFQVDDAIINWVLEHGELIKNSSKEYLSKKLNKALEYNQDITINLIDEMKLWPHLPPLPELAPYMIKGRL